MNAPSRRARIEAMLVDDPTDTFLRYSLGLELVKEGQPEAGVAQLMQLTRESPPFVPAFLMAAQQYVALEQPNEARAVLRTGIEEARLQGDAHAASELGQLLMELGSAGE